MQGKARAEPASAAGKSGDLPPGQSSPRWGWVERHRAALFGGLSVLLVAGFSAPLWQLLQLSFSARHYSHIVLIPLVSAYFLGSERHQIFSAARSGSRAGGILTASGLILLLAGMRFAPSFSAQDALSLTIFSLLLLWSGLFGLLIGTAALRRAAFPFCFLLFMVPIPTPLLGWIISLLQHGSAEVTHWALQLSGTPVFRSGEYFSLPGLQIHVAPECSGIRSSLALVITAVVAGRLFLQRGQSRLLLILAAVPITIFKNGLRIAALSLLTIHVNPSFMAGNLHSRGGYPFFLLALAFLAPVLWLLRRSERPQKKEKL